MNPEWYATTAEQFKGLLIKDGRLITKRAAAKLIGRPETTTLRFLRWFAQEYAALISQESQPVSHEQYLESDKRKTWTEEDGTVITDLGEFGLISFTQNEFRSIRRAYSKHYGGKSLTQAEITIRYGFPTIAAFDKFRKVHELRQNSIPYTDSEILEEDTEELVAKTLESKKQKFFLDLQAKEQEQQKRDAEKWRALEANMHAVVSRMNVPPLPVPDPIPLQAPAPRPYALVLGLVDLHIGKMAHSINGERVYDRRIATERALTSVRSLLREAIGAYGVPDKVILNLGQDNLHVDTLSLTTTAGTAQAGQSDGDFREMATDYIALLQQVIQIILAVAPIHIVEVEGNHDRTSTLWAGMIIEQSLRGNPRATYTRERGGLSLINYGNTSLLFAHGDGFKLNDAPRVAIVAARERGMQLMPFIHVFCGHLHHEHTKDLGGVKVHVLPSLSAPDAWHRSRGYVGSQEECVAFIIRESGGKAATLYTDPEELKIA